MTISIPVLPVGSAAEAEGTEAIALIAVDVTIAADATIAIGTAALVWAAAGSRAGA